MTQIGPKCVKCPDGRGARTWPSAAAIDVAARIRVGRVINVLGKRGGPPRSPNFVNLARLVITRPNYSEPYQFVYVEE